MLKSYNEILFEFKNLPKTKKTDENIFSICGFPHYEKVSSNILSFFLDKNREHNLKDLFLTSLFDVLDINTEYLSNEFEIETEVQTDSGKYIDILIFNEDISIVIENKIYANLYNDLENYYSFVKTHKVCNHVFGVVLGINKYDVKNNNFRSITYEDLFLALEKNINSYIYLSKSKYLMFYLEYISSIRSLNKGENMNNEFIEFIKTKQDEVFDLNKELKLLHDDFRRQVKKINNIINQKIGNNTNLRQWAWRDLPEFYDIAVTDHTYNGINICLHTSITLYGWFFEIWERSNTGVNDQIEKMLIDNNIKYRKQNRSFELDDSFSLSEEIETVANKTLELIELIIDKFVT